MALHPIVTRILVVSAVASGAIAILPAIRKQLHPSHLSVAQEQLETIREAALHYAQARPLTEAFPPSAPLTPAVVPQGLALEDPLGSWDHLSWRALGFRRTGLQRYALSFESYLEGDPASNTARAIIRVRAQGDLDGDGTTSLIELVGERRADGSVSKWPGVYLRDEWE